MPPLLVVEGPQRNVAPSRCWVPLLLPPPPRMQHQSSHGTAIDAAVHALQDGQFTTKGYDQKAPIRTSFDQRLDRYALQDGPHLLAKAALHMTTAHLSDDTRTLILDTINAEIAAEEHALERLDTEGEEPPASDTLLYFLTQHLPSIHAVADEGRDQYVRGLLEIYELSKRKGGLLPSRSLAALRPRSPWAVLCPPVWMPPNRNSHAR